MVKEEISRLVEAKRARVGVIGLGYVGLPLAVEFARKGLRAVGFEVDARKAELINRGESYIGDVQSAALAEAVSAERLHATTDFDELAGCDAIIICVPTPLRKTKEPDISYILAAASVESSVHPPTTFGMLSVWNCGLPGSTRSGLKASRKSSSSLRPRSSNMGSSTSSVVPG